MKTLSVVKGMAFRLVLVCIFALTVVFAVQHECVVATENGEQNEQQAEERMSSMQEKYEIVATDSIVVCVSVENGDVFYLDFENETKFFNSVRSELLTIRFNEEGFSQTNELIFPEKFFGDKWNWKEIRKLTKEASENSEFPILVQKVRIDGDDCYMISIPQCKGCVF